MIKEILDFKNSKEWIEFANYYNDTGFTEQLGLFRYEDANTNFLKSVLEDQNTNLYGFSINPMKLFIEMIQTKSEYLMGEDKSNYFKNINTLSNYTIDNLKISVRDSELFQNDKPDMVITFEVDKKKYFILLEAKLFTTEHNKQCLKYYKYVEDNEKFNNYEEKVFLYLTLDGATPPSCTMYDKYKSTTYQDGVTPLGEDVKYIPITYQELIDYIYNPLSFGESKETAISLDDYIKSFTELYYQLGNKYTVISYKGKMLTEQLLEKHSDTINRILDKPEEFTEFYKSNDKLINLLFINIAKIYSSSSNNNLIERIKKISLRIQSNIVFNGKEYNKSRFVYEVFKQIIKDENIQNINDLKNINYNGQYKYIYTIDEYNNLHHYRDCYSNDYYGELKIGEDNYYYQMRVNDNDIDNLIELVNEVYPKYNIRRIDADINTLVKR
ncbi:MAG: PD-(D/E)XK nuclease family protein [Candidatus Aphodocola sp.]